MGVLFIASHTTVIVWCIVRIFFFLYIVIYLPSHKSFKCKLWNTWSFIFYALPIHMFSAVFKKKWLKICLNFMYSVGSLYAKIKFTLLLLVHQIVSSSVEDETSKQV